MSLCECKKKTCCKSSEKARKRHDKCCSKCSLQANQLKAGVKVVSLLSAVIGVALIVAGATSRLAANNLRPTLPIVEPVQPPFAIDSPPTAVTPGPLPVTEIIEDTPYNSIQVDESLTPKP